MSVRRVLSLNPVAVALVAALATVAGASAQDVPPPAPASATPAPPARAVTPTAPQAVPTVPSGDESRPPVLAAPPSPVEPLKARYQLRVMEGVLENAVQHGIRSVGAQMRLVTPDLIFFGSPARARGFRLEGFGTFFDVDVPTLRPSVAWSVRTLSQMTPDTSRALQSLRRVVESQGDARARHESEQALRLIELQVSPLATEGTSSSPGGPGGGHVEPAAAYETEVKRALVEAILDYGNTISLGPEDWLAVAARANDTMGQDALDSVTVLLKIKGGDLHLFRLGSLSRDEARQRVSISEF
jgi:hypothetical protein